MAKGCWVALSYLKMMGKISEMRRGEQVMLFKKMNLTRNDLVNMILMYKIIAMSMSIRLMNAIFE